MAEVETSPEIKDRVAKLGGAALVIALPGVATADGLREATRRIRPAVEDLAAGALTVIVHPEGAAGGGPGPGDADGPAHLPFPFSPLDRGPAGGHLSEAYRAVFGLSARLGARGCVVVRSDLAAVAPEALVRLIRPVLAQQFDLITPQYRRRRFDALLSSAVVTPITRALYGKRIAFPAGADFACSARLVERCLQPAATPRDGIALWITSEALCGGFQVGQAQLGVPSPAHDQPAEVSGAVAQVVGPVFQDMELHAAYWQKVRGSQPVPTLGFAPPSAPEPPGAVDVAPMIESFRLGYRNLQEIWGAVLPPATLLQLTRLTRLAPESFRLPDELWVRVIYDFALAYRLRVMSRDHLLGALTPVYLAWVASYALEVGNASPAAVEQRLERLGAAYEAEKPYLVSRWRWPDRFNP